jgi:hypothetical protein
MEAAREREKSTAASSRWWLCKTFSRILSCWVFNALILWHQMGGCECENYKSIFTL